MSSVTIEGVPFRYVAKTQRATVAPARRIDLNTKDDRGRFIGIRTSGVAYVVHTLAPPNSGGWATLLRPTDPTDYYETAVTHTRDGVSFAGVTYLTGDTQSEVEVKLATLINQTLNRFVKP